MIKNILKIVLIIILLFTINNSIFSENINKIDLQKNRKNQTTNNSENNKESLGFDFLASINFGVSKYTRIDPRLKKTYTANFYRTGVQFGLIWTTKNRNYSILYEIEYWNARSFKLYDLQLNTDEMIMFQIPNYLIFSYDEPIDWWNGLRFGLGFIILFEYEVTEKAVSPSNKQQIQDRVFGLGILYKFDQIIIKKYLNAYFEHDLMFGLYGRSKYRVSNSDDYTKIPCYKGKSILTIGLSSEVYKNVFVSIAYENIYSFLLRINEDLLNASGKIESNEGVVIKGWYKF